MKLFVIWLFFVAIITVESRTHYDNFKLYQVTPKSMDHAQILKLYENNENFDFWSDLKQLNAPVDIMVSPDAQYDFEVNLKENNIEYNVLINDIEKLFEKERNVGRSVKATSGEVTFSDFMRYDEIVAYVQRLGRDYPDIVTVEMVGKSFEGRDIYLIKISSGESDKPMIFAEAAIHAREWIAPCVALYIINQLVENPENSHLYSNIDWAIIPVSNPDGYEFSHVHSRLWRKTRTPGTICYGVDGNRNFDYQWGTEWASSWQCDLIYAGHEAFSEPETRIIRDTILRFKDNIKLYLAIHSYGPWVLYPWGYTLEDPENAVELKELGQLYKEAILAINGTEYEVGRSENVLYYASGTSTDWAAGVAGIDLSYIIELPGGGSEGFDIPAERIEPVVEETWEGFKVFHGYIQDKFGSNTSTSV